MGTASLLGAIDADHLIFTLRKLPSFFERFFLGREFPRHHFMLQLVIDIANEPSHLRFSLCRPARVFDARYQLLAAKPVPTFADHALRA